MTTVPSPYETIRQRFMDRFQDNWAVAFVVLLSAVCRLFSTAITGPSGSGKTKLAQDVIDLVPDDGKIVTSRISGAALSAMDNARVVLCDELIADHTFDSIRRMLVSSGQAAWVVGTSSGKVRKARITGPTAFIECHLRQHRDFQDSNRAVVLELSDSIEQVRFHAEQTVRRYTPNGMSELLQWDHFRSWCRRYFDAMPLRPDPILDINEDRLVPLLMEPHSARRLQQVLNVAFAVANLTDGSRRQSRIRCTVEHLDEALSLLLQARVVDDHQTLDDRTRAFFAAIAHEMNGLEIQGTRTTVRTIEAWEPTNIESILSAFNSSRYTQLAKQVIHESKRHPRGGVTTTIWTRAIVTPLLQQLRENNLLIDSCRNGVKQWSVTPDGIAVLKLGGRNTFFMIRQHLHATATSQGIN